MSYRPNPGSLAALVVGFFARNPKEVLTLDDVIEKFVQPGDARNVHHQLAPAYDHELLNYDAKNGFYSLGPVPMPSVLMEAAPIKARRPAVVAQAAEAGATAAQETQAVEAKKRVSWSDEQVALLRKLYPVTPAKELALVLGRSTAAVKGMVVMLGLKKTKPAALAPDAQEGESHGSMDGPRTGVVASVLSDGDTASAGGDDRKAVEPDPQQGALHGDQENSHTPGCAQRAALGVGAGGQARGAGDPQDNEHGAAEKGLETSGRDRVGSPSRAHSARAYIDAQKSRTPTDYGQSGAVHERRALPENIGAFTPAGDSRAVSDQGADQYGRQGIDQGALSPIAIVRQHLLDTLIALRRPINPMPVTQARAVTEVVSVMVNLARVEVDYLKATQQLRGEFFEPPLALENQGVAA